LRGPLASSRLTRLRSADDAGPAVASRFVEVIEQIVATTPPVGRSELDVGGFESVCMAASRPTNSLACPPCWRRGDKPDDTKISYPPSRRPVLLPR